MCHERWALHVVIKRKFFFTFVRHNAYVRLIPKSIGKWKFDHL